MEPRTRFVRHHGRPIVLMDFSRVQDEREALQIIAEARRFVAAQPRMRTLLTLVDVSASTYTPAILEALQNLAKHDEPWVLAGAVVGLNAFRRIALRMITMFSGRQLAVLRSREDAMDWLVQQEAPPSDVPDLDD
jgi:hypothetical protein